MINKSKNIKNRILLTEEIHFDAIKLLKKHFYVFKFYKNNNIQEMINLISKNQINGIIVRGNLINKDVLQASNQLRVVVKHGVGYNNIDIDSARRLKISILYTPYANYNSVAEFTVGLIYSLFKKIIENNRSLKDCQHWNKGEIETSLLKGKIIGLIGFGKIARRVSELVAPLNMKIFFYDPYISFENISPQIQRVKKLDELLKNSDIISLHCPSTKDTRKILGKEEFKIMKKGAYLVNTARGDIIDEVALIDALKKQLIAGVALDTFTEEPLDKNSGLYQLENVILTSHIAGTAKEDFRNTGITCAQLIIKVLKHKFDEIDDFYFIEKGNLS